jgi:phosphatidylserine decarboxylase
MSHNVLRIKSLVEVILSHEVNSYVWKWFKSHAQGVFAQREETKLIATLYKLILRQWHMKTLKTQVVEMVIFS